MSFYILRETKTKFQYLDLLEWHPSTPATEGTHSRMLIKCSPFSSSTHTLYYFSLLPHNRQSFLNCLSLRLPWLCFLHLSAFSAS